MYRRGLSVFVGRREGRSAKLIGNGRGDETPGLAGRFLGDMFPNLGFA